MNDNQLLAKIAQCFLQKSWSMVCAESCTGGGLSYALTALPGSSKWFHGAYVTYSEQSKIDCLGVSKQLLDTHGAVSKACALAMAKGAASGMGADVSLAITGLAGPTGASDQHPVGTVWLAMAGGAVAAQTLLLQLHGDRQAIRQQCIAHALRWLYQQLS